MPRGKTEKTKLKEAIREALRQEVGYRAALALIEEKHEEAKAKGHAKKPIEESIRQHLGKMIDRIDPLESGAIVAMTVVIQPAVLEAEKFIAILEARAAGAMIQAAQETVNQAAAGQGNPLNPFQFAPPEISAPTNFIFNTFESFIFPKGTNLTPPTIQNPEQGLGSPFQGYIPSTGRKPPEWYVKAPPKTDVLDFKAWMQFNQAPLMSWMIAFVIAFLTVRYGADFIKSLGGISGILGLLI